MPEPKTDASPKGYRAAEVIGEIFKFEPHENLDPDRGTCLSFVLAGDRRCGYFDKMQREDARRQERIRLVEGFLARTSPENPMNFKAAVMRFIELAVCHRYHIHKMIDAADEWYEKLANDTAPMAASPVQGTPPGKGGPPLAAKSPEVRHYSTGPVKAIEMKQYIKGRDEEQLRRLIEEPLDEDEDKPGEVYITQSSDLPGYIKIGYTCQSLETRFRRAREDCNINIQPVYTTGVLPHAKRLEAIVHNELAEKRYRFAKPCTFCVKTRKRHEEWFLTTVEYARGVADFWKVWLLQGMYDRERKVLALTRLEEVLLLATPVKIKERELRLSPRPASTDSAAVAVRPTTPDSPSPPGRHTSHRLVEASLTPSPSSKAKNVNIRVVEVPLTPSPTPKARDVRVVEVETPSSPSRAPKAKDVQIDVREAPPTPSPSPKARERKPDGLGAQPALAHSSAPVGQRSNTSSKSPPPTSRQPVPVAKPSPKTADSSSSTQKGPSIEDRRRTAPVSEFGVSVTSLMKRLLETTKDGAEGTAFAEGKFQISGTELQIRARPARKKEGQV